ncbi:MAG: glutamate-5-semialdehyde dehydrogenase [Actinomycetota bacterium]|nr:glutamate-5-semialdehyde dehydrogenase [Actinomycetota bacterium]MDD5601108.1 glutamate-5-semialdehyde dehydrogenase [Actinomycetota bacterium]
MDIVTEIAKKAKESVKFISNATTELKNKILFDISKRIISGVEEIVKENEKDIDISRRGGASESFIDRLKLDRERIEKKAESIDKVIRFNDPVGEVVFGYNLPNGLILKNIRVPLGVVGIIYEARPEVTIDASVLCLKAGNSVILRGSSHALNTNKKLVEIMGRALKDNNLPVDIIQIVPTTDKEDVIKLMQLRQYVDVLIPRGGKSLIGSIVENSKVPVIETGIGNCHIYIDDRLEGISLELITKIVINAKTQRPSVCNAAEKLLVHSGVAQKILPFVLKKLEGENVKLFGCPETIEIYPSIELASEEDWYEEYLDYKMAVKVVKNIEEAVTHINKYGSHHTEAIITSDYKNSIYFTGEVDSAAVFVNASTRFTDGEQFGMGAEIGISTQKLHWRGPMGLRELTTNKFIISGNGQIRE